MKFKRKLWKQPLAILLAIVMCATSLYCMPMIVQAKQSNQEAQQTIYAGEGYEVTFKVTSSWAGAFNVNVEVKNTGINIIDNWAIGFTFPYEITNIWNAEVDSAENGMYVIKNAIHNQDIAVGNSVNFGFSAKCEDDIKLPEEFYLLSYEVEVPDEEVEINFKVTSDWNQAFNGEITIKNISDKVIEDWKLEFDFDHQIERFWTASIVKQDGNHYCIKNVDYNANIKPGETIILGFSGKPGNGSITITQPKLWQVVNKIVIPPEEEIKVYELSANKTEFSSKQAYEEVIFYLNIPSAVSDAIALYEDNDIIAYFYDDGNYLTHGDDIKGDGVYSAKYNINLNVETDITNTYHAHINQHIASNNIEIKIVVDLSEEELINMQYVDSKIEAVLKENLTPDELLEVPVDYLQNGDGQSDQYKTIKKKRNEDIATALNGLKNDGYIGSYSYDEINGVFNCEYSNGIPFGIIVSDVSKSMLIEEITWEAKTKDYSAYNAAILNAFEDTSYRTKFYEKLVKEWRKNGMIIYYDDYVTVSDLKTCLSDNDIISFSGHGTIMSGKSVFCLKDDIASTTKDKLYSQDMKNNRVIKAMYSDGTSSYTVTNNLFSHYYGPYGLDGSFIFAECCKFMGDTSNGLDLTFANTLVKDCSTEAVVGFFNSVMATYSRDFMVYYFEELLNGDNAGDAFKDAKDKYGSSDFDYRVPSFWEWLIDRDAFEKMGDTAFPYLIGDEKAVIMKALQNGDFEIAGQNKSNVPLKWSSSGDVRVLSKLGVVSAYDSNMVFLSTGIGAKSNVGDEGSTLSQTVYNTDNTYLELYYDFISEEPMEYIGSKYDDKFEIQILDTNDNILHSEVLESVNKSTWYSVENINFEGGDDTVYHTGWKKGKIDISAYQNKTIKIRFLVYDIGDSVYDSAVVIDNVNWSK